jgi:hypothetical protein
MERPEVEVKVQFNYSNLKSGPENLKSWQALTTVMIPAGLDQGFLAIMKAAAFFFGSHS